MCCPRRPFWLGRISTSAAKPRRSYADSPRFLFRASATQCAANKVTLKLGRNIRRSATLLSRTDLKSSIEQNKNNDKPTQTLHGQIRPLLRLPELRRGV